MRLLISSFIVIAFITFVSCDNTSNSSEEQSKSHNEGHGHDHENGHNHESEKIKSDELTQVQARQILSAYLRIKDALVQTNGEAASAAAADLMSALGDNQQDVIRRIRLDAEHISKTKDPQHQRDHFYTLSNDVYEVVKNTEANESTLYRQYCPMARDNKGAFWLSANEEIRNPYYGKTMLTCGKVENVIN